MNNRNLIHSFRTRFKKIESGDNTATDARTTSSKFRVGAFRIARVLLFVLTVLLLAAPLAPAARASEAPPLFKLSWGGLGSGNGQFNAIQGIAIDSQGNVYVADQQNNRIQKFTATGAYLTQWYSYLPLDVAIDANDVVFVTEWDKSIRKYDTNGTLLGVFAQFDDARGVAFDAAGNVYAVNHHFGLIHKYASNGTLLATWAASPFPVGIAVDSNGNVYVTTDRGGGPILKFAPNGTQIASFNFQAYKIALGADGNLYGADPAGNRVQKFTTDGELLSEWGTLGTDDGEFTNPAAIAVAANGEVYVGELVIAPDNPRVQVFTYTPPNLCGTVTPPTPTIPGGVVIVSDCSVLTFDGTNEIPPTWPDLNFDDSVWQNAVDTPCEAYSSWNPPYDNSLWIWNPVCIQTHQYVLFRKKFTLPSNGYTGELRIHADDGSTIYLNGVLVGSNNQWPTEYVYDLTPYLVAGDNVLAIFAQNTNTVGGGGGPAGVTFRAEFNPLAPTPTNTPTLTPTNTPQPTDTPTVVPTNTPQPTDTPTVAPTITPQPTNTPTVAPTNTPLPTATATATPAPSQRDLKQGVLDEMVALRATLNKKDANKLDQAIDHLTQSLDPSLWLDGNHLQPKNGKRVFQHERETVVKLLELLKKNSILDATLNGFIDRLVAIDRSLAVIAINDAINGNGDANKIAKANQELAKGDDDAANGKPNAAIEHFRNAWKHALKAIE